MFSSYPASRDTRDQSLKDLDREANQRFGAEANRLFGAEARRRYAPQIENLKRQYARQQVDQIRGYSDYVVAGAGIMMAYASSGYGFSVSWAVGVISAFAAHIILPPALDTWEEFVASNTEVETRVEVRAVYA